MKLRFILIIVFAGFLILSIIGLIYYGNFLMFLSFINPFTEKIEHDFEINRWYAKAISVIISGIYVYAITLFLKPWNSIKFKIGCYIFGGGIFFHALIMGYLTKDYTIGTCEAYNPKEDKFVPCSCNYEIHPIYRTIVRKLTLPDYNSIIPKLDEKYFLSDGITPVIWYSKLSDGRIRLFRHPGGNPYEGGKLKLITNDIAKEIQDYLNNDKGMIAGTNVRPKYETYKEQRKRDSIISALQQKRDSIILIEQQKRDSINLAELQRIENEKLAEQREIDRKLQYEEKLKIFNNRLLTQTERTLNLPMEKLYNDPNSSLTIYYKDFTSVYKSVEVKFHFQNGSFIEKEFSIGEVFFLEDDKNKWAIRLLEFNRSSDMYDFCKIGIRHLKKDY